VQVPMTKPIEALRAHTHAVILITADGVCTPELRRTIDESRVDCELISHPLLAMAALCWNDGHVRRPAARESTALILANRGLEDLATLINSVKTRLPHVAIWVFESEIAILISAARSTTDPASLDHRRVVEIDLSRPRTTTIKPPQLRIAETALPPVSDDDGEHFDFEDEPTEQSAVRVSPEEFDMLLQDPLEEGLTELGDDEDGEGGRAPGDDEPGDLDRGPFGRTPRGGGR
jgi:hypothetical protein